MEREEECEFFDILGDEAHELQAENPLLYEIQQGLRSNDAFDEKMVEPIKTNVFSIDIPLEFVLRGDEDGADGFLIEQSLKYFLVGKIFSTIQSND